MSETPQSQLRPAVPYMVIPDGGDPYLVGSRCAQCNAAFLGEREVCSSCGSRDEMSTFRISDTGELYVYSIVHRSFPGIPTPYVSAVVDMDGGGTVKGNLIDVEPDPEHVQMGMRVRLVFDKTDRKDAEGNEYMAYFFRPEESENGE